MPKFASPVSYTSRKANSDHTGQARFASASESAAATADDLIISPVTLASAVGDLVPSATTAIEGVVLLTDNNSPVATKLYADNLAISGSPNWSESVSGIGQLSTNAEAVALTNDTTAMTPLKVGAVFAAPPALGSGTPGAGSFTTIAASGAIDFDAGGSFESGGTAINIGADNSGDAVNLGTGTVARAIGIGNSAAAHVVTVGSVTGTSQVILNSGTAGIQMASTGAGDITIDSDDTFLVDCDGVLELNSSAGVIGIGNDADAQNINIGTGAAARTITVGNGTSTTSVVIEAGTGAIDIGTNAIAHSTTIGNKTGASALVLETGTGQFSLDGVGATTYSIGASTTSGTIQIGVGAQTGTMTLGDSSGTNIVEIGSGEGATTINIAGGATNPNAVTIATGAVASTVAIGSASAGALTLDSAAGISIDVATASNISVSGATEDLTLASAAGRVIVDAGEDAADAIYLHADAGTSETIRLHSDQGTGAASVHLESDVGGVTLTSGLASADAINLSASAGGVDVDGALAVNIASSQAAATALTLSASNAAGGIDITTGGGSIDLSSAGSVTMVPGTSTAAAATGTVNKNVGVTTHTGLTTASAASQVFTITNSVCTVGSAVFVSASNLGANDAQMTVTRVTPGAGSFTVTLTNNGAAALNGDVILTWWIIAA